MSDTYTFRSTDEAGNIQGCAFKYGIYVTNNEDRANALRSSSSFGKTVFEVTAEVETTPVETPPATVKIIPEKPAPKPKPKAKSKK